VIRETPARPDFQVHLVREVSLETPEPVEKLAFQVLRESWDLLVPVVQPDLLGLWVLLAHKVNVANRAARGLKALPDRKVPKVSKVSLAK